jgi:Fe-S cluster biogenesis protein NfuA
MSEKFRIFTAETIFAFGMSLKDRVEQALNTIRPYLEADGGNVDIAEITADNVVKLRLLGSCASCAMSIMTFKAGLEQAIKKAVPEVTSVEAINITDINDPNATMPR